MALIVDDAPVPQKFWIEKTEDYKETICKFNWEVIYGTYIGYTTGYGLFPKEDGTYGGSLDAWDSISVDYTTWTEGAYSDFNGKENTLIIPWLDWAVPLKDFNEGIYGDNLDKTDWYIPACGQLALILLNIKEINYVLDKTSGTVIGGKPFKGEDDFRMNHYWSSTDFDDVDAWYVDFDSYKVSAEFKAYSSYRFRFIRDIN